MASGKERRLSRLIAEDGRTLLVAMDHSLTVGPTGGLSDMGRVMREVVAGGVDAVIAHRGGAARGMPVQRQTGMVVHLSGNTELNSHAELKTRVCDPDTALRLGADAVSAHVTLGGGHQEDRAALTDLGLIAGRCEQLELPLLVMTYVLSTAEDRGPGVLHAARVAAELGADVVKASHPGEEHLAALVTDVPVPVVIAGGPAEGGWDDFLDTAKNAMGAGVAGLCVGRRIFGAADSAKAAAELSRVVHGFG